MDTEVLNELKITSIIEKINVYESNWTNHVNRMPCNRLPQTFKKNTKRQKKSRKNTGSD